MKYMCRAFRIHSLFLFVLFISFSIQSRGQVVQHLTAAGNDEHINIYWEPFSSASGYILYWGTSPNVYPNGNQISLGNVIGYSHTGLVAGQTYYYNVVALVGGQASGPTVEVYAVPFAQYVAGGDGDGFNMSGTCLSDLGGNGISPAPANFTIAAGIGQDVLFWDPVANCTSYTIGVSSVSGGPYTALGTTSDRYYIDRGLTAGTPYYYIVTANFSGACAGGSSSEGTATPISEFTLGGDGDGFAFQGTCNADLNGTSVSPAPANFTLASGIEQNILFWDPVANAISYDVQVSMIQGGPYSLLSSTTNRYYVDKGLTAGNNYYYIITANFSGQCAGGTSLESFGTPIADFNAGGIGDGFAFSGTCYEDLTGNSISPAPANFTVAAGIEKNIMYWDPVPNATSYSIDFSLTSGGPYTNLASTTDRYYVDKTAVSGSNYYYVVSAVFSGSCAGGVSLESAAMPVADYNAGGNADGFAMQTTCNQDLNGNLISITPNNFTIASSNGQNILYWDPVSNTSSYSIYQSTSSSGPFNLIGSTSDRWYKDANLQADTTYYYQLQIGFGGNCLGGTTNVLSAKPYAEYVGGGIGDGFTYGSSGFFSLLSGPAPIVTIVGSNTICLGDSISLISSTASNYQWNVNGSSIQGAIGKTLYPTISGNYSVTTNGGTSIAVPITVNPKPSAIAGVSQHLCAGQTAQLGSNPLLGSVYSWSPGLGLSDSTIANPIANPSSKTLYTLKETIFATGCFKTDTVSITPSTLTAPLAVSGRDTGICAGQNVNLGTNAIIGNTYAWTPSTGLSSDQVANPMATPSVTTTYILTETVTAFGCYKSDTVTIQVNPIPLANIQTSGNTTLCQGDSVILSATSAKAYSWSNGASTQNITIYQSGNFTVSVIDSNTCANLSPVTSVLVNTLPSDSVIASGNLNICQGNSVTLTALANGNYLWSDGSTTKSVILTQNGNYTVQLTDSNGCHSVSSIQTISVGSLPQATISSSGPLVFCQGDSVQLQASAAASYLWSSGETTQNIFVKQSGNYAVYVTGSNSCAAQSSATNITVNALPTSNITAYGPLNFCQGGSVTLGANNSNAYLWSDGSTTQFISATKGGNYSVTVTDGNLCQSSSPNTNVTIYNLPTANISVGGSLSFCQGDSAILTADPNTYYAWSSGESTQNIHVKNSGVFSVTVSDIHGCSATSSSVTTTSNTLPISSITPSGNTIFCQGDSILLTASAGSSYLWNTGSSSQSIYTSQSGNYTVTITDVNACKGVSNPQNIQVIALPSNGVQANGPLSFCQGGSVLLTADPSQSYLWSNGKTTQSITVNQSGIYHVLIGGGSCTSKSNNISVSVNPLPLPVVTASGPLSFCQGDSVILTSSAHASYLWSGGKTTQSITVKQSGNYSVLVTNGFSCTDSSAVSVVNVNPLPTANILANGPLSFCQGDSVKLTASSANSYLWSNGETTQSITVHNTGSFSVTVSNLKGCQNVSSTVQVLVNPLPSAAVNASGPLTFCQGKSVTLNAASNNSYLWSNGATTQSVNITQSGSYSVVVSSNNNCKLTSSALQVQVNALPTASINASGPLTFCQGGSVILNTTSGTSWLWSNTSNAQQITVSSSGNYSVTVTDANGCSAQSSAVNVTVNPLPSAIITPSGNQSLCQGDSIKLQSSAASSYLWSTGAVASNIYVSASGSYAVSITDAKGCKATSSAVNVTVHALQKANISASGPLTFCQGNQVVLSSSHASSYLWTNGSTTQNITVGTSGNYGLSVLDSNLCSASANPVVVTVHPLPVPQITAGGPTTFCPGGTVTLSSTSAASYLWNTGATTQNIVVNNSGTYSVSVTNSFGCSGNSNSIQVQVNPAASASITPSGPLTFCQGDSVILTANVGSNYLWSTTATSQSIVIKSSGSFTVNVTSPLGCYASSQATVVVVNPLPLSNITVSGNTTFCQGDSVKLTASTASTYNWSNGKSTQTIYVKNSGSYSVTITDGNSCSAKSASVAVTVNPLPLANITSGGPLAFCFGEFVKLTSSPAQSYFWSNGSTAQSVNASYAGTYSVTIKDGNACSASASVVVTVYSLPAMPIISQSGNVLSSSAAVSYQWNLEGAPISGATNQSYTATVKGNYTVTITNANGCKNTSDPHYTGIIGIDEISILDNLSLSPNPFNEAFYLTYSLHKKCQIEAALYDVSGQLILVLHDEIELPGEHRIEYKGDLAAGFYFLKLQIDNQRMMIKILRTN